MIQNETEEESNSRRENIRMPKEECFRQEWEQQQNQKRNTNAGAIRNERNA